MAKTETNTEKRVTYGHEHRPSTVDHGDWCQVLGRDRLREQNNKH